MKPFSLFIAAAALLAAACGNPARQAFDNRIDSILDTLDATVGIALLTPEGEMIVRNDSLLPTMSVFKFPLALAVMNRAEQKRIPLSHPVKVGSEWLDPDTFSPLRDSLPSEGGTVTLADLLRFSVSHSDNIACNILLHEVGGPAVVDAYVRSLGIDGVQIKVDERAMRGDMAVQRLNAARPSSVCRLFDRFLQGGLLSAENNARLRQWLETCTSGPNKLKAGVPAGTVIGHKTGFSDRTPEGLRIADNDAGYVLLPDGRRYCITVFVTDSPAGNEANAAGTAAVSKAVWDYLSNR